VEIWVGVGELAAKGYQAALPVTSPVTFCSLARSPIAPAKPPHSKVWGWGEE